VTRRSLVLSAVLALACDAGQASAPYPEDGGSGSGGGSQGGSGGSGTGGSATGGASFGGQAGTPTGGPFPFPQNQKSTACVYPTFDNAVVTNFWNKWKSMYVTSDGAGGYLRVKRGPQDGNDTVSEGIAYGMVAAVYMDDQATFDGLWGYAQIHVNNNGIMNWKIDAGGNTTGQNGATDADEDMAWALVMADYQWGGYLDQAKAQIERIWEHEVDHGAGEVLKPGDLWGGADQTNPSYFSPAYYRVFAKVTNNPGWNAVIDSSYAIIEKALDPSHGNQDNGLVPAWCDANGVPTDGNPSYQYDACRTPFRIALDVCFYGEQRARDYLAKTSSFFAGIGPLSIKDGYQLNGTPQGTSTESMAFVGPAGVGAMSDGQYQTFVEGVWTRLVSLGQKNDAAFSYYNSSWGLWSVLMMSGNFLDYTQL
jgi:endo-1,4-beta-D-glucanase Y